MEQLAAGGNWVALVAPGLPEAAEAERFVRRALTAAGERPWAAMEIEVYPGAEDSLVIARPVRGERVYIISGAARLLAERYGGERHAGA